MAEENEKQLDMDEVRKEGEEFLNIFHNEIPNSITGIASFIRKDDTSDTWFYGNSEEELLLLYSLLIKQLADHLDENMFELILHIQTKLAQVYQDDYIEYMEKIQKFGEQFDHE